MKKLLTAKDVSDLYGIGYENVLRMAKEEKLPVAVWVGRSPRFTELALDRHFNEPKETEAPEKLPLQLTDIVERKGRGRKPKKRQVGFREIK